MTCKLSTPAHRIPRWICERVGQDAPDLLIVRHSLLAHGSPEERIGNDGSYDTTQGWSLIGAFTYLKLRRVVD